MIILALLSWMETLFFVSFGTFLALALTKPALKKRSKHLSLIALTLQYVALACIVTVFLCILVSLSRE